MKKQIVLIVTLMSSIMIAWAQPFPPSKITPELPGLTAAPSYCPTPTPIAASCVPATGPLNPIPGISYTYSVTVTNGGTAPKINWFVTKDPAFLVGGVFTNDIEKKASSNFIMAAGSSYNDLNNTSNSVDITWKSVPSTTDIFLVTYTLKDGGCTDNVKVYKIVPVHAFTLDLATLNNDGTQNTTNTSCVSPVQGASYNTTSKVVEMDYGVNYVYFTVNAANFAHSWLPSFQLTATNTTTSTTLAVDWAYPNQSSGTTVWHPTTATGAIYSSADAVTPLSTTATGVGATGECIVVRVTIDHNKSEVLTDIVLSFAVNGMMYDQVAGNYTNPLLGDIHHSAGPTSAEACPWYDGFANDKTTFTLSARPTIVDEIDPDPASNFIPGDQL